MGGREVMIEAPPYEEIITESRREDMTEAKQEHTSQWTRTLTR